MKEDTKRKIASALTGRKLSPETREKMAKAKRGRKTPLATRYRIQASNMDHIKTPEHLAALAEARQRNMQRRLAELAGTHGLGIIQPPRQLRNSWERHFRSVWLPSHALTQGQWAFMDSFLRSPAEWNEDFIVSFPGRGGINLWGYRFLRGANDGAMGEMQGMVNLDGIRCKAKQGAVTFDTPQGRKEILITIADDPHSY